MGAAKAGGGDQGNGLPLTAAAVAVKATVAKGRSVHLPDGKVARPGEEVALPLAEVESLRAARFLAPELSAQAGSAASVGVKVTVADGTSVTVQQG